MSEQAMRASPLPPRWIIKIIWTIHRAAYSLTGGRFGLRRPTTDQWGTLRLRTVGRRTGRERVAILGYIDDGVNLVIPAMNGWADAEPAWWLNLQTQPVSTVELPDGRGQLDVIARAASPDERVRLWRTLVDLGSSAYTDANAARRSRETTIAILEPLGALRP
jgi:F420H(2)-dependent quinone reductase